MCPCVFIRLCSWYENQVEALGLIWDICWLLAGFSLDVPPDSYLPAHLFTLIPPSLFPNPSLASAWPLINIKSLEMVISSMDVLIVCIFCSWIILGSTLIHPSHCALSKTSICSDESQRGSEHLSDEDKLHKRKQLIEESKLLDVGSNPCRTRWFFFLFVSIPVLVRLYLINNWWKHKSGGFKVSSLVSCDNQVVLLQL